MATRRTYVQVDAEFKYAKVFEHNRDFGNGGNIDFTDTDGRYSVELILDDENKGILVKAGVPERSMGYDMFRETEDGRWSYRPYRTHLHKHLTDDETGERLLLGPPEVVDLNAPIFDEETGRKSYEQWDPNVLIGNGSKGKAKLLIVFGKTAIVSLVKIGVSELVSYEAPDGF